MSSPVADSTLRAYYRQEFERLQAEFEAQRLGRGHGARPHSGG